MTYMQHSTGAVPSPMSPSTNRKPSCEGSSISKTDLGRIAADRTKPSSASSQGSLSLTAKVAPYARTISYKMPLSNIERESLRGANVDNQDPSAQDFDFEDLFTYDLPQKRLTKGLQVSSPTRERDWSNFSFSHYTPALSARQRVNDKSKSSISEMYLRNQVRQGDVNGKK